MRWSRLPFAAALLALVLASTARAETEVDVALVLAVDVSRSMDPDEQDLQRDGFVEAFRSSGVHEAIAKGALGRIAVTYFEWSGASQQVLVLPWTVIDGPAAAGTFADRLQSAPISRFFSTSISGALDYGVKLFESNGIEAMRRVIDVSGDGPNNDGRVVTLARDAALAEGVVVNGLPIMLKRPTGYGDIENLDQYFKDCVIGGPGAFIVPVRDKTQFAEAVRTKLIREIADLRDPSPWIHLAQSGERADCLIGEQQRRRRWGP
jgi:hypothetical protein